MLKALTYLTKVSTTPENNALGDYGKRKKLWHDQTSARSPIQTIRARHVSTRNLTSFELSVRRRNRNPKDTTDVIKYNFYPHLDLESSQLRLCYSVTDSKLGAVQIKCYAKSKWFEVEKKQSRPSSTELFSTHNPYCKLACD
jgi:hypothetical protein